MHHNFFRSAIAILLCLQFTSFVVGDDWPQFLGQHRNGKSKETGLINKWPESGLTVHWQQKLGESMAGIAIVENNVLTLYQDDDNQYLVCLSADDGSEKWKTAIAPKYENSMGHGPRTTPTIAGDSVFAFSGEGILGCYSLKDGKEKWKVDTQEQNGGKPADYGMAGSPIVIGSEVIVATNPGKFSVCGFSVSNGKFLWGTNNQTAGYASPTLLKSNAGDTLAVFCGKSIFGVEPVTGRMIWDFDFETEYDCNNATPINVGNDIFISSGENHGSVLLSIEKAGEIYKVTEQWSSLGRKSVLRSEWQTPIHVDGYIYGFDNVGSAGPVTHLTCVEAKTGKRMWQKLRFDKGNLIYADGKLIISTMKGEVVLVEANSKKYVEIGRQKILGQTRQAPSLSNGKIYLRDNYEIVCIDLKK